ncbi:hypothetical protein [Streptomyces sp. NPDC127108]|uniref:hypothetical protein n=1 Tax=Streptomyces sp. NPDC127108 TaxID=3345361 RepID=UPI0036353D89
MNMDLDERWARWCERFDAAEHDIRTLFLNRHIWLSINEMWEKNADAIELNTLTFNWHVNLYVATQCTGIRRGFRSVFWPHLGMSAGPTCQGREAVPASFGPTGTVAVGASACPER